MKTLRLARSRVLMGVAALLAALGAGVLYAALAPGNGAAAPLTAFAPEGALLALESPDFAGLLRGWTGSAEQKRWLASDNYAGFERSRLFDRLGEAQNEFADAAGLAPDARFLQGVAGGRSVFAWYDIGNLEFLYITRMAPGAAARSPLMSVASKFERREAGGTPFYLRVRGSTGGGQTRTVAFAVRGDYLLLATREDLMAGALGLMAKAGDATLEHEAWYAQAVAAASAAKHVPGDLRMSLDLARIVKSPYFRTYWVQGNVTEIAGYRSSVADLYRTAGALREERVLLPVAPDAENVTAPGDLSAALRYLPADAGVYRASAAPDTDAIVAQMEDKLLARRPGGVTDTTTAPAADLSTPSAGGSGPADYDTRIDTPPLKSELPAAALEPLRTLLDGAHATAMLVTAAGVSAPAVGADPVFGTGHAAVVLTAAAPWNAESVKAALAAVLGSRLSVGVRSLVWHDVATTGGATAFELGGMAHLAFAVQGPVCVVASDVATLQATLAAAAAGAGARPVTALSVAGFRHAAERPRFLRLVALLDHKPPVADAAAKPAATASGSGSSGDADASSDGSSDPGSGADAVTSSSAGSALPFLSGNMAGLSNTFRDLAEETVTETRGPGGTVLQTVVYRWKR